MSEHTARALRIWLYAVAMLVALMVIVGGATRLTESGLSITEWRPITGALPPLNDTQWQDEFGKYRMTTQYKEINRSMTLENFKKIYWWEWAHRFLGRLVAVAFALPLLLFGLTRDIPRPLMVKLGGILALGALQGVVGWWMVASGLSDRVNVAPFRLAIHLTLALAIFASLIGVAQELKAAKEIHFSKRAGVLFALLFLQIFIGGLVAGSHAGYVFNTWPLMDGGLIPSSLFAIEPWWRNFFENLGLVQFMHRVTAYALLIFAGWNLWRVHSSPRRGEVRRGASSEAQSGCPHPNPSPMGEGKNALILFLALLLQAGLGIATLLSGMSFVLALAHQAGVILVMLAAMLSLRHAV